MIDQLRQFVSEPHWAKSPLIGFGGFLTSEHLRGCLQWVVLVGTAFLITTQAVTWIVRHFICRPRDGRGPCTACKFFGRWICPGPRGTTERTDA